MAAHTSLLLVIALCAATAHSLRCHTCDGESTNDKCLRETYCSYGDIYCQTVLTTATVDDIYTAGISKRCASSCTPFRDSNSKGSTTTSCCATDLCNYSATIRSSRAAILLALGSVLIILKSSVL